MRARSLFLPILAVFALVVLLLTACGDDQPPLDVDVRRDAATPLPTLTFTPTSFATPRIAATLPRTTATPIAAVVGTPARNSGETRELTVVARDNYYEFEPNLFEIPVSVTIRLTLNNEGTNRHSWRLRDIYTVEGKEPQTEIIPGGQETTLIFIVTQRGMYTFRCDVYPAQMTGTLTVN